MNVFIDKSRAFSLQMVYVTGPEIKLKNRMTKVLLLLIVLLLLLL